jgi:hypothetical protein
MIDTRTWSVREYEHINAVPAISYDQKW